MALPRLSHSAFLPRLYTPRRALDSLTRRSLDLLIVWVRALFTGGINPHAVAEIWRTQGQNRGVRKAEPGGSVRKAEPGGSKSRTGGFEKQNRRGPKPEPDLYSVQTGD